MEIFLKTLFEMTKHVNEKRYAGCTPWMTEHSAEMSRSLDGFLNELKGEGK